MTDSSKKVSETSSGEVVNGFRSCRDLSDIVPLYSARGVYLKPIAKIHVSINLPQLKTPGKTISTWEVMEKLRLLIRPDEFVALKVVKSTLEFIRFEGDLGDRSRLQRVLARLDGQRLNLAGFPNVLKVKAAEMKDEFPTRHSWDSYFRDAKHMNELKAGERPDTIHITGLPVKWFSDDDGKTPSESIIAKVFKRWGVLRRVDVPAGDPYRSRMRLGTAVQKFSYEDGIFFDAYIQYIEYMDFIKAMDALRGMKLLKKDKDKNLVASIKVDFDKTKHMSDNSVSHREFERKRLIAQDNLAAEKIRRKQEAEAKKKEELKKREENDMKGKDSRRRMREEKRKRKALTVIRKQEEDKVSLKIAREERKLIKAQRQLESIRLLDALFDRIKIKVEKNEIDIKPKTANDKKDEKSEQKTDNASKDESNNVKKKDKKEKSSKKKNKKEKKKKKKVSDSEESDSDKKKIKGAIVKSNNNTNDESLALAPFPRLPPQAWYYNSPVPLLYPPHPMRGFSRGRGRGGGRGRGHWRDKDNFNRYNAQDYNEQYYKYFASLVGQDYHAFIDSDHENSPRSRSRNRRKSRSNSRSRSRRRRSNNNRGRASRSKSRSKRDKRSNSKKRTRSRSKSRSRSRTRSCTRSRSRSRSSHREHLKQYKRRRNSRHRSRAESRVRVTRAKSRPTSPKRRSRSSSWSLPKTPERKRSCSWEKKTDETEANGKKTDNEKKTTTKAPSPSKTPPAKEKRKGEEEKKNISKEKKSDGESIKTR